MVYHIIIIVGQNWAWPCLVMILLSNLGLLTFIMDNIISWRWDIGDCPVPTVQLIVPSHNIATLTILELQSITSKLVLWLRKKLHEQIKTLTSWKHFYQWVRVTTKKKKYWCSNLFTINVWWWTFMFVN